MNRNLYREFNVDAIIDSAALIDNKAPVYNFFDNVLRRKPSKLTILNFTIEGKPIILMITFDGNTIKFVVNNTYADGEIYEYTGNRFIKRCPEVHIYYELYQDNKFVALMFSYKN